MDPITAIGLAFSILKLALTVIDFLRSHPAIGAEAKAALDRAASSLATAQDHVETAQQAHVESP